MPYVEESSQSHLPRIRPLADCPECKGTGFTAQENGRQGQQCLCVLKQEALRYLGDIYASASFIKTLDVTPLVGKNLLLQDKTQTQFKSIVKSFLLNTAMRNSHSTASGYDVVQAYLTNSDSNEFTRLKSVDLLVLYLNADPNNKAYGNILTSLINDRMFKNRHTWIYTPAPVKSAQFRFTYGEDFANFVSDGSKFTVVR